MVEGADETSQEKIIIIAFDKILTSENSKTVG